MDVFIVLGFLVLADFCEAYHMAKVCPVQDSRPVCGRQQDNLDIFVSPALKYADLLPDFSLEDFRVYRNRG